MSKVSVQMKKLMRSPKAMMDYQLRGRLPQVLSPDSPLITYLESIGGAKRLAMKNVNLSPLLGYSTKMRFGNAQSMLVYLKPQQWVSGTWPAYHYQIKSYCKVITKELFDSAQVSMIGHER
jgi:hypothetical protein